MRKLIRFGILLFVLISMGSMLTACKKEKAESSGYSMYYLNKQRTKIVNKPYDPSATDTEGLIEEFITQMSEKTDDVDYQQILTKNMARLRRWRRFYAGVRLCII